MKFWRVRLPVDPITDIEDGLYGKDIVGIIHYSSLHIVNHDYELFTAITHHDLVNKCWLISTIHNYNVDSIHSSPWSHIMLHVPWNRR